MEIIKSIFIGGLQGVSEFLPVSSSGHLVLIPYVFKWTYQGLNFDIALHFGTTIAVIAYFWRDWVGIIKLAVSRTANRNPQTAEYPRSILWQILLATIPAVIFGLLLNKYENSFLRSPLLIAANLAVFGIILWALDKFSKKTLSTKNITYLQTFFIGCAQALALVPGVSRSGVTMSASRYLGLKREDAAKISFLLSTPAIVGAFIFSLKDLSLSDINLLFVSSIISSTVFGFLAIRFLLKYLKEGNFSVFVWYRILVALIILSVFLVR